MACLNHVLFTNDYDAGYNCSVSAEVDLDTFENMSLVIGCMCVNLNYNTPNNSQAKLSLNL